jgi:hypothetical protein
MSNPVGACALCGEQAELLPMTEEAAEQPAEHLLCGACDELLGADDVYLAELAYRDEATAILEDLSVVEAASEGLTSLCTLSPSIDRKRICRFAASILWRAHVSRRVPQCDVGDRYAADLRAYLRRQASFPDHLYLVLVVHLPAPGGRNTMATLAQSPRSSRERGYYAHTFMNRGFQFLFTAGKDSPETQRALCLCCAPKPFFIATGEDNVLGSLQDRAEGWKPGRKLGRWIMTGGALST